MNFGVELQPHSVIKMNQPLIGEGYLWNKNTGCEKAYRCKIFNQQILRREQYVTQVFKK